jgi:rSAM/selenodomain-associated transferase 1
MTAVAIFVKTPALSPVKTRLAAGIGAPAAQHFYLAAATAVASVVRSCGTVLSPYWAVAEPQTNAWCDFPTICQGDGDLGERMRRVYDQLLAIHGAALLIGADAPQITAEQLIAAANALQSGAAPYVLGPAKDGGFWLLGGRQPMPITAWRDTPWSQPNTLAIFTRALDQAGQHTLLDTLTDIDRPTDLADLRHDLARLIKPTPEQMALATWLQPPSDDVT